MTKQEMAAKLAKKTGLSASIGIAGNKSIAKIASDYRKPHGITAVTPADVTDFLDSLPVRLINGCGPKTTARLAEWDIHTVGELARCEPEFLVGRFGSHGAWLHDVANGRDDRDVCPDRGPGKSRGNERTYPQDEHDPAKVMAAAKRLMAGLLAGDDGRAFATITVKLRYSDFTTLTRSHTLSIPIQPGSADAVAIAQATVESLLGRLLEDRAVRLVGVRLSGFQAATGQRVLSHYGVAFHSASSTATSG